MPLLDLQTTEDGYHIGEEVCLLFGHNPGARDGECTGAGNGDGLVPRSSSKERWR